jgi:hypothetical protein
MLRAAAGVCALALTLVSSACGAPVDLKKTLQVSQLTGGWFDAGFVEGRNKLIPSVTFRLRKSADASLRPLSVNVVFKRLAAPGSPPSEEDWEEVFLQSVTFDGSDTPPLTVRPNHGYTGDPPQSRADMLQNSQFRDIRVHLFAKHSASQWVEVGQFDIPRQLLTQ